MTTTREVRYPEHPNTVQQPYSGGYISFVMSPTEEISPRKTSSLGGVANHELDSQDWIQRNKKHTDVVSIITSRDPSIVSEDELLLYVLLFLYTII